MKKPLFIILVLALPFGAGQAAGTESATATASLQDARLATEIIDNEILLRSGEEFGEIEDIVIDKDGNVAFYSVEPEMDVFEDFADLMREDADMASTTDASSGENRLLEDGDTIRVDPRNLKLDVSGNLVLGDVNKAQIFKQSIALGERGEETLYSVNALMDMDVNLDDEESFGEIEDVLLDARGSRAVALVIDNWSGLSKHRRAFPVKIEAASESEARLPFRKDEAANFREIDLEHFERDE